MQRSRCVLRGMAGECVTDGKLCSEECEQLACCDGEDEKAERGGLRCDVSKDQHPCNRTRIDCLARQLTAIVTSSCLLDEA